LDLDKMSKNKCKICTRGDRREKKLKLIA